MKYTSLLICLLFFVACDKENPDPVDDRKAFHTRNVGASANELLSASKFSSLRIQIQYMPGYAPDANALNELKTFLQARLNKPGGITIEQSETPAANNSTLSVTDVGSIETNKRTVYSTDDELSVYILYTNGRFVDNNVLGIAYRNTSCAIFGGAIHSNSGGIGQVSRTRLESTVLIHELGHLLGLVDLGTPMQTPHKAANQGSHCNNDNCIMYYASETTDALGFLLTGAIPVLDPNCINDLKANGGK